jgi:hypothetical protein
MSAVDSKYQWDAESTGSTLAGLGFWAASSREVLHPHAKAASRNRPLCCKFADLQLQTQTDVV